MKYTITTASSAAVIDSLGAQLLSLQDVLGTEYVWQRDPAFWPRSAPVLFPVVGRMPQGRIRIEGKVYEMGIHGFAKEMEFSLYEQGRNTICFVLHSTPETLAVYPYKFEFYVRFTLTPEGLTTTYSVQNVNRRPMQFCIGGHPGFCCPLSAEEQFSDYELRFETPETIDCPRFQDEQIRYSKAYTLLENSDVLPLHYDLFNDDAIILEGLKSRRVSLVSRKSKRGMEFSFPDFSTVAFWTPPGKQAPFLCFEPWFGMGNRDDEDSTCLADKKGVVTLPESEMFSASFTVSFL